MPTGRMSTIKYWWCHRSWIPKHVNEPEPHGIRGAVKRTPGNQCGFGNAQQRRQEEAFIVKNQKITEFDDALVRNKIRFSK